MFRFLLQLWFIFPLAKSTYKWIINRIRDIPIERYFHLPFRQMVLWGVRFQQYPDLTMWFTVPLPCHGACFFLLTKATHETQRFIVSDKKYVSLCGCSVPWSETSVIKNKVKTSDRPRVLIYKLSACLT